MPGGKTLSALPLEVSTAFRNLQLTNHRLRESLPLLSKCTNAFTTQSLRQLLENGIVSFAG